MKRRVLVSAGLADGCREVGGQRWQVPNCRWQLANRRCQVSFSTDGFHPRSRRWDDGTERFEGDGLV
jgi:hypothetical protein